MISKYLAGTIFRSGLCLGTSYLLGHALPTIWGNLWWGAAALFVLPLAF